MAPIVHAPIVWLHFCRQLRSTKSAGVTSTPPIMFASTRLSEYLQNIDCTLRVAQHADCTGQAVVR